jgi:hypothetical protein
VNAFLAALRGGLHWLFTWAVALLILFEEWGWEPLARLAAQWARLPLLARIERRIARLSPYRALAALTVPALALLPVKLLALYAVGEGHLLFGLSTIVLAKLLGTAILARLFQLTRPALMKLAWFAAVYLRWLLWKRRLLADVRSSPTWLAGRRVKRRARVRAARLWRRWALH